VQAPCVDSSPIYDRAVRSGTHIYMYFTPLSGVHNVYVSFGNQRLRVPRPSEVWRSNQRRQHAALEAPLWDLPTTRTSHWYSVSYCGRAYCFQPHSLVLTRLRHFHLIVASNKPFCLSHQSRCICLELARKWSRKQARPVGRYLLCSNFDEGYLFEQEWAFGWGFTRVVSWVAKGDFDEPWCAEVVADSSP
jgi:hypothetical protein